MDQQFDFRALLLKLQDCLSDNDRRRLHFIVGDTIPRHLRDDPTLGGTLNLLESLFDQAKISEQDFDYLIHAFSEIHCYEAVKRLKQHQQVQSQRGRSGTTSTNLSDVLDDNEEDRIHCVKISPDLRLEGYSKERNSGSSQATTISLDKVGSTDDQLKLTKPSVHNGNKLLTVDMVLCKRTLKSRLTICQILLFLMNIIGIVVFLVLLILFAKSKRSMSGILVIKTGSIYGNIGGGDDYNDAQDCSLTYNEKIVSINAGWTADVLDFVTFSYSNGQSKQHGRTVFRESPFISEFILEAGENINGVSVYTGTRLIDNPFSPNGSLLVVGLRFYTDRQRSSDLFGSSNGTAMNETVPAYALAYVRGKALGYVDAIQFIWYRLAAPTSAAALSTY